MIQIKKRRSPTKTHTGQIVWRSDSGIYDVLKDGKAVGYLIGEETRFMAGARYWDVNEYIGGDQKKGIKPVKRLYPPEAFAKAKDFAKEYFDDSKSNPIDYTPDASSKRERTVEVVKKELEEAKAFLGELREQVTKTRLDWGQHSGTLDFARMSPDDPVRIAYHAKDKEFQNRLKQLNRIDVRDAKNRIAELIQERSMMRSNPSKGRLNPALQGNKEKFEELKKARAELFAGLRGSVKKGVNALDKFGKEWSAYHNELMELLSVDTEEMLGQAKFYNDSIAKQEGDTKEMLAEKLKGANDELEAFIDEFHRNFPSVSEMNDAIMKAQKKANPSTEAKRISDITERTCEHLITTRDPNKLPPNTSSHFCGKPAYKETGFPICLKHEKQRIGGIVQQAHQSASKGRISWDEYRSIKEKLESSLPEMNPAIMKAQKKANPSGVVDLYELCADLAEEEAEQKDTWDSLVWYEGKIVRVDGWEDYESAKSYALGRAESRYGKAWLDANAKPNVRKKKSNTFVAGSKKGGYSVVKHSDIPRGREVGNWWPVKSAFEEAHAEAEANPAMTCPGCSNPIKGNYSPGVYSCSGGGSELQVNPN